MAVIIKEDDFLAMEGWSPIKIHACSHVGGTAGAELRSVFFQCPRCGTVAPHSSAVTGESRSRCTHAGEGTDAAAVFRRKLQAACERKADVSAARVRLASSELDDCT